MNERRKFERCQLEASVEYSGSEGVACSAVENASFGGMRLVLTASEQPGTPVKLNVRFPEGDGQSFEAEGLVVWARQAEPYLAGVQFIEPDESRAARLEKFMHE